MFIPPTGLRTAGSMVVHPSNTQPRFGLSDSEQWMNDKLTRWLKVLKEGDRDKFVVYSAKRDKGQGYTVRGKIYLDGDRYEVLTSRDNPAQSDYKEWLLLDNNEGRTDSATKVVSMMPAGSSNIGKDRTSNLSFPSLAMYDQAIHGGDSRHHSPVTQNHEVISTATEFTKYLHMVMLIKAFDEERRST